jgi:hypothetical protein
VRCLEDFRWENLVNGPGSATELTHLVANTRRSHLKLDFEEVFVNYRRLLDDDGDLDDSYDDILLVLRY